MNLSATESYRHKPKKKDKQLPALVFWCLVLIHRHRLIALCLALFAAFQLPFSQTLMARYEAGRDMCAFRVNPDYMKFCNPRVDGVSCQYQDYSRLTEWVKTVDHKCAILEHPEPLVIYVDGPSAPSLKPT